MQIEELTNPHKRYNPLTGQWVLVSPQRSMRPWLGHVDLPVTISELPYDDTCYLCPSNDRVGGIRNPNYEGVFVFENDFPALMQRGGLGRYEDGDMFVAQEEGGVCKVMCFSPRHDLSIPDLKLGQVRQVVASWIGQYKELGQRPEISYVQIFENKGSMMGCSNPHPHAQIWATTSIPDEPQRKQRYQEEYFNTHGHTLLSQYWKKECEKDERLLFESTYFVVLVPFWAVWPFEAMILPKRPMPDIAQMHEAEIDDFALCYQKLTQAYDALFQVPFPYSAGIHQAPTDEKNHPEWHWHMVFYPPLLRSATVRKFMVGYEMLANPQRDITPEQAAKRLALHF